MIEVNGACTALRLLSLIHLSVILAAEIDANGANLDNLFRTCFSRGFSDESVQPNELVTFSVHGIDNNRDVTLTFKVETSQTGLACTLEWVQDNHNPLNSKGDIRSLQLPGNSLAQPMYDASSGWPTEVRIRLLNIISSEDSDFDYIILRSLYPNKLVSARFIKEFLVVLENRYRDNNDIRLLTVLEEDNSNIRELYWLQKGEGKTYFEQEWGLEYDCLMILSDGEIQDVLQISASALNLPALIALGQAEFPQLQGYAPIPMLNPEGGETGLRPNFRFSTRFIGALETYRLSKSEEQFQRMTIRDVLQEFISTWTVGPDGSFTQSDITMMARNTFMYFFRNHQNFTTLARQVLHDYDPTCRSMTGFAKAETLRHFDLHIERRIDPVLQEPALNVHGAGPSSAAASDPTQEVHLSTPTLLTKNHIFFIILFTFVFHIYILFLCCRYSDSETFDAYVEL